MTFNIAINGEVANSIGQGAVVAGSAMDKLMLWLASDNHGILILFFILLYYLAKESGKI